MKRKTKSPVKLEIPTYEGSVGKQHQLIIQLPPIQVYGYYGIPRLDNYHTEEQRYCITLPISDDDATVFDKVDKYLDSKIFRQTRFDKQWNKYTYVPLVKKPEFNPAYIKLKIDKTPDAPKVDVLSNGQTLDVKTIDDVANHVNNSLVTIIIQASALWMQAPDAEKPMYGLTLKAIKIKTDNAGCQNVDCDFV